MKHCVFLCFSQGLTVVNMRLNLIVEHEFLDPTIRNKHLQEHLDKPRELDQRGPHLVEEN